MYENRESLDAKKLTEFEKYQIQVELFEAIKNNETLQLTTILEKGITINDIHMNALIPLHYAIKYSSFSTIKALVGLGANINQCNNYGENSLHKAVKKENLEIIEFLIESKADVNAADNLGWTPLTYAIREENLDLAALLLKNGANLSITKPDNTDITPFEEVVMNCLPDFVELFIKNGANINYKNTNDQSPLLFALNGLITYGGGEDKEDKKSKYEQIIHLLLEAGADLLETFQKLDNFAKKSFTPAILFKFLKEAINKNHIETIKSIIKCGFKINNIDENSENLLHIAIRKSNAYIKGTMEEQTTNKAIIQLLLDNNINVNAQNKLGNTPLYLATFPFKEDIVTLLIEHNGDLSIKNQLNQSPMELAHKFGADARLEKIITKGIEKNSDIERNYISKKSSDTNSINILEKDINSPDEKGRTKLFRAVVKHKASRVEDLLNKDANTDSVTNKGMTALYAAAFKGYKTIVKLLINFKADVNQKVLGFTPLHAAVFKGKSLKIVKDLVEAGANLNTKTPKGHTPLEMAEKGLKKCQKEGCTKDSKKLYHQEIIDYLEKLDEHAILGQSQNTYEE